VAVNFPSQCEVFPVPGARIGTANANIKGTEVNPGRDDLAVIFLAAGSKVAGLFTRNGFRAAPVLLAEHHLSRADIRALLINSGNANAATGEPGIEDARKCCEELAAQLGLEAAQVIPFSTGVIGVRLPLDRILQGIKKAAGHLSENDWLCAAKAIMTTDTEPKCVSRKVEIDGHSIVLTGMAKGSGMIRPDMATMLAYIATNIEIAEDLLSGLLERAANASFNRITVDGDTSTNDSMILVSTATSSAPAIVSEGCAAYTSFLNALVEVSRELSQMIIRDAEGATKFVTVTVSQGGSSDECLKVAYALAESPLVKTALFAGDPNWGRFCMAIGKAGLRNFDTSTVNLYLDDVCVAENGLMNQNYREEMGARVMRQSEFTLHVTLGLGESRETIWTSDLSYDYVKINAEYRT